MSNLSQDPRNVRRRLKRKTEKIFDLIREVADGITPEMLKWAENNNHRSDFAATISEFPSTLDEVARDALEDIYP